MKHQAWLKQNDLCVGSNMIPGTLCHFRRFCDFLSAGLSTLLGHSLVALCVSD